MEELAAFLGVNEVELSLLPRLFELYEGCDQIRIVLQLRVYSFDVFFVFSKQLPNVLEAFSYGFGQFPHSLRLTARDPTADPFGLEKNFSL